MDCGSPRRPDPTGAVDGGRRDRHLIGDRDGEGAVFETFLMAPSAKILPSG